MYYVLNSADVKVINFNLIIKMLLQYSVWRIKDFDIKDVLIELITVFNHES